MLVGKEGIPQRHAQQGGLCLLVQSSLPSLNISGHEPIVLVTLLLLCRFTRLLVTLLIHWFSPLLSSCLFF